MYIKMTIKFVNKYILMYINKTIKSDIDIAIIGGSEKDLRLEIFEKLLERKIIINYYKSFKEIRNELLNNILNGITLKGAVDL